MPKPSDDLSALFRSLRPDETVLHESSSTSAREAEQRWPLLKILAPQKPLDTPALSEQERQRWVSQEKPAIGIRKPALSLPGLSNKMSTNLGKMSGQMHKNTAAVKPATRWESSTQDKQDFVEQALGQKPEQSPVQALERTKTGLADLISQKKAATNQTQKVKNSVSTAPTLGVRGSQGIADKKLAPIVSTPLEKSPPVQRKLPANGSSDGSLKSIFNRLEAKPEVEVKPAGKRSPFLERLGKR